METVATDSGESARPTRVHVHAIAPAIAAPARMTAVASRDRSSNAAASSTDPISIVWRTTITIVAATTASAAIPDGTTLVVGPGRSPARTTPAAHAPPIVSAAPRRPASDN